MVLYLPGLTKPDNKPTFPRNSPDARGPAKAKVCANPLGANELIEKARYGRKSLVHETIIL